MRIEKILLEWDSQHSIFRSDVLLDDGRQPLLVKDSDLPRLLFRLSEFARAMDITNTPA